MNKIKWFITMSALIYLAACSSENPFGYSDEELETVKNESYELFSSSLHEVNDKSDVTIKAICEIDERTMTTDKYKNVFIVQIGNKEINVGLNNENVDMIGQYSDNENCKKIK